MRWDSHIGILVLLLTTNRYSLFLLCSEFVFRFFFHDLRMFCLVSLLIVASISFFQDGRVFWLVSIVDIE